MMRRLFVFALGIAGLLSGTPLFAQQSVPIYLVVRGELMQTVPGAPALEPVTACALPADERYLGAPVISPDGRLLALKLQPAFLTGVLARVGGFAGGEYPSDLLICDPQAGITARFGQPEDAALFDPAGRPNSYTIHSAPSWSLDGASLAWTECGPRCEPIDLRVHDLATGETRAIAQIDSQYGVPVSVPVAWEGPIILVYSDTWDAASGSERQRMLGFDPITGDVSLDAPLAARSGTSYTLAFFWIEVGGVPQVAVLRSSGAWLQIDPATGQQSLLDGAPELVGRAAPNGVSVVADARNMQAGNLRWLAREGDALTLLGDDVRGFTPPSIAPDGGALLYYDHITPALWRDGTAEFLPLPQLSPNDAAYAVWGPGMWRVYVAPLAAAASDFICFGAPPPRLQVGAQARVAEDFGANNLRAAPDINAELIAIIPAGAAIRVADGPVCANGYAWWQVAYDHHTGWTVEGEGIDYWLVPDD